MADTLTLNIGVVGQGMSSKIVAVRIQDSYDGSWYNGDGADGAHINWDRVPQAHAGYNLYIAVYAISTTTGTVKFHLYCPECSVSQYSENLYVSPNNAAAIEVNMTPPQSKASLTVITTLTDVG